MQCPICKGEREVDRGDSIDECSRCDGTGEIDDPYESILEKILATLKSIDKKLSKRKE